MTASSKRMKCCEKGSGDPCTIQIYNITHEFITIRLLPLKNSGVKKAVEDLNNSQQGQKSQTQTKKETQHQPLMFNAEKSKQQELLERLENIEKRIRANLNYQNRQRRINNQTQNQNQNQNQNQSQNQNQDQNQNQNQN